MRKTLLPLVLFLMGFAHSQVHRFYYELTYKPNTDSAKTEKEIMVLDVSQDETLFMPYNQLVSDSAMIAEDKKAKEKGVPFLSPPYSTSPKFSFRIIKEKTGSLIYKDFIGVSEYYLYNEKPTLKWKISPDKEKIGNYQTQKATTDFGGRHWTAWFTSEIPIQDGPYKFSGLPGLIVKLEDSDKNFIWLLEGNKKLEQTLDVNKLNYLEYQMGKPVKISKIGFNKRLGEYNKNPMGQMIQMFDEKDATLMKALKEQEIRMKKQIAFRNNPIEIN